VVEFIKIEVNTRGQTNKQNECEKIVYFFVLMNYTQIRYTTTTTTTTTMDVKVITPKKRKQESSGSNESSLFSFEEGQCAITSGYEVEIIPADDEKKSYILNVWTSNLLYRGNTRLDSAYIETLDILKIMNGEKNFIKNVETSYRIEMADENAKMVIHIDVTFQLKKNLKPVQENHEIVLFHVERDQLVEDISKLKKVVKTQQNEISLLKKRSTLSMGYFDSRMRPLAYEFYFQVEEEMNSSCYKIAIHLSDNLRFIDFLMSQSRFCEVNKHFTNRVFEICVNWMSAPLYEENNKFFTNWIINFSDTQNYFLAKRSPADIKEYLASREFIHTGFKDQKILIDNILITLFELNLEYELHNSILLPPTHIEPRYQSIPIQNVKNVFNIQQDLENEIHFNEHSFYNPNIGFYKCPLEQL
jgi:hypothetical protein